MAGYSFVRIAFNQSYTIVDRTYDELETRTIRSVGIDSWLNCTNHVLIEVKSTKGIFMTCVSLSQTNLYNKVPRVFCIPSYS